MNSKTSMDPKSLSDFDLLSATRALVSEERRLTAQVLGYLEEVERRRLHLEGYSSLFQFCCSELGYSENEAHARISAMRLSREITGVVHSVEAGRISLTNLVKAQSYFNQEKKAGSPVSIENKRVLLQELEQRSVRECERLLANRSPQAVPQERERPLSQTQTQISLTIDDSLMKQLERIRELWGHHGKLSYAELMGRMAEVVLGKIDPERRSAAAVKPVVEVNPVAEMKAVAAVREVAALREVAIVEMGAAADKAGAMLSSASAKKVTETNKSPGPPKVIGAPEVLLAEMLQAEKELVDQEQQEQLLPAPPPEFVTPASRYIPAVVRKAVWARDHGRCTQLHADGTRCSSRFALELDHVIPYAYGGAHTVDNLRLLCRAHHRGRSLALETDRPSKGA